MKYPKLSIIIPVYNVENYLRRCLDSVINQTFKNLEIIIINDASPDNCQEIIDEYQKKDKRIIPIINEKNLNLGLTRNVGIERATGNYITFVDSDDWLEKEMYEEMMNLILKSEADIVECNFRATNDKNNNLYIKSLIPYFKKSTTEISDYIIHLNKNELGVVVWNKIYLAEIMKVNKVKFEDNKKFFCEDLLFNLVIMHYAKSIITINRPLYNYFVRDESMSHSNDFISLDKIINIIKIYIENTKKFESFENDFFTFSLIIILFIKNSIVNEIKNSNNKIKSITQILKNIRENELILKSINCCLKNRKGTLKYRFFCLLIILKIDYLTSILFLLFTKK